MAQATKEERGRAGTPRVTDVLTPRFFKALCDPSRLTILAGLAECRAPRTVGEIARGCAVDLSVVSRHLGILRDAGILQATKQGKQVYYSVRADALVETLRAIANAVEACCCGTSSEKASPSKK